MDFSSKVKFKVGDSEVELGPSANASIKHKIAFEDCLIGSDIARYCRSLPETLYLGRLYFIVDEIMD